MLRLLHYCQARRNIAHQSVVLFIDHEIEHCFAAALSLCPAREIILVRQLMLRFNCTKAKSLNT